MMATPPPTPPSPPQGDGTPDAGNPAGAAPPQVAPKPGRQSERATKKPAARSTKKPAARKPASKRTTKSAASEQTAPKPPAAPRKPTAPRAPVARRPAARPRPRPAGLSVATAPTEQPVSVKATDSATRDGGRWWRTIAGGIGALAAGAALFSLRGSSHRKAHRTDGTDSSESLEAGIAGEGTIPEEPTTP